MTSTSGKLSSDPKEESYRIATPRFIITGFGPFGSVLDNPTTVIVRKLRSYLEEASQTSLASSIDDCIILETSAQDVQRTCDRLQATLLKDHNDTIDGDSGSKSPVILLHLGVDEGGKSFKLEACAYNQAKFRIPDMQGFQPNNDPIFEEEEVAACLRTSLNVDRLASSMENRLPEVSTKVSTDPGRYVCNYVYCCSLYRFGKVDSSICSLFLHVPPFSVVPENTQLEYVSNLLEVLTELIATH